MIGNFNFWQDEQSGRRRPLLQEQNIGKWKNKFWRKIGERARTLSKFATTLSKLKVETGDQCDQIGLFLKVLGNTFSYKSCKNPWWQFGLCLKTLFSTPVSTSWETFVKFWVTFYFRIWSHCWGPTKNRLGPWKKILWAESKKSSLIWILNDLLKAKKKCGETRRERKKEREREKERKREVTYLKRQRQPKLVKISSN